MCRASFLALNRGADITRPAFRSAVRIYRQRRRTEALDQWLRSGCLFHRREGRFRARRSLSTSGANCAGALPAVSTAICSSRIRSATHPNTTVIVRWARRTRLRRTRTRWTQRLGPSSTASSTWYTATIGWRNGAKRPRSTLSRLTRTGRPSRIFRTRSSSDHPVLPPRLQLWSALRDGKRLLVIGAQVPRDEAGKVVGKGDMRAQIEQVGKNVGACLKAGWRNSQRHCLYDQLRHGACRVRQKRRSAAALFRPAFAGQ